ncbi:MAG: CvpA family protein [Candidatus Promineofilum sp.]|nr:CvpA family protein [Promineifilum sp.]MCW5862154.1 CvpA family protein [Anaerolineae bacterium]
MLSLNAAFWIMVLLFALVGAMRGWTKEIVVTSAIILALFTLNQFFPTVFSFIGWDNNIVQTPEIRRWQFFILSGFLLVLTFFGYQGPSLARGRAERLARRDNLQDKLLGFLVGALNGWLIVGSIWSFLEYRAVSASTWVRFTPDVAYPFNTVNIIRPAPDLAPFIDNLPIPVLTASPYFLPLLLVVVFLFILVVLL